MKIDKPEVIANAQGAHSTPSVVAFNENETLGEDFVEFLVNTVLKT